MSTSFPGALDDFTNPSGSQSLAAGGHSQLHADLNDAVEALEAKVGADSSAVTTSHDYLLAQLAGNLLLGAGEISVTGETTATIGRMHVCSGTAADYNVFLPTPAGNAGKLIGFRMSPLLTKFVTLIGTGEPGTGTGSIDHAASRTMWTSEAAILYCDGADWFKVAGKTIPMTATAAPSGNTSIAGSLASTKISLNTVVSDPSGLVDTGTGAIIARRDGTLEVTSSVRFTSLPANVSRLFGGMWRTRSGVPDDWVTLAEFSGLSGCLPTVSISIRVTVLAGDVLELYAGTSHGSAIDAVGSGNTDNSFLSVAEVDPW